MKIGFIGIGNMASAIIEGIDDKANVLISARTHQSSVEKAKTLGVNASKSHKDCVLNSDLIVLGVKPEVLEDVLVEIKDDLNDKTIVSIAAKKDIAWIESIIGKKAIIRVMPNLNVKIKKGSSAICKNELVDENYYAEAKKLFANLGEVFDLKESQFSAFIGIAGSMPAFVFKFIHEAALSVVNEGIDYDLAIDICASAVIGSAELLRTSDDSATVLIDKVSSPNGTTIEGTKALDENNFGKAIHKAIAATILKDKKG